MASIKLKFRPSTVADNEGKRPKQIWVVYMEIEPLSH